jgi:NAD+ diphosphatase
MEYCVYCGGKTIQETNKRRCGACGKTFYNNPKAAVAIVLYTQDTKQLLLARRARKPELGKLDFIGGFLDVGETFEDAVYRELAEESGLARSDIGVLQYITSTYNGYEWEGNIVPTTSVCYIAELLTNTKPVAGDDASGFEFYDTTMLPANEDCAWQDMPRVLREVAQAVAAI